jgi:hypothetical protein
MSDLLENISDVDAENWIPEAGDGVQGIVDEVYDVEDNYNPGETVPVVVLTTDSGERWSVAGYRSGLRTEIRKYNPEVGVKYLGEVPIKRGKYAGRPFHKYRAAVSRGGSRGSGGGVPQFEVKAEGSVTPPPAAVKKTRKAEIPADEPPF